MPPVLLLLSLIPTQPKDILEPSNLVAWCVVPFDASQRGPEERAKMLKKLGFSMLAYDWRAKHVPTFEKQILALKKQGIEMFAFWGQHESMFRLIEKHGIAPQIWQIAPSPRGASQKEKVEKSAKALLPLVNRARKLKCKVGLYNHGGWSGEPENMVAVCQWLRKNAKADHVGLVYNFHHGHGHIKNFSALLSKMKPYLLCVNLNGMNPQAKPKILPLGKGKHEVEMMRALTQSGYKGPIGILDHRSNLDAEKSLRQNLDGLQKIGERLSK